MSLHRLTIVTLVLGLILPLSISLSSMELSSDTAPPSTSLPPSLPSPPYQIFTKNRYELIGLQQKIFIAPELSKDYDLHALDCEKLNEYITEAEKLAEKLHAIKRTDTIQYFNQLQVYENKIGEINALIDVLNPKFMELHQETLPRYASFCDQGYVFDWQKKIIDFPSGTRIQYHLTKPATVTNPKSRSALTAGLISGVGSFTAILTENWLLTGAVVLGSTALHRYGWTPYKQGKSSSEKIIEDGKALVNLLRYFKKPAPNNQSASPTATTPLLPAVSQSHPQGLTDVSVPCVTVVDAKPEQNLDPKDPKAEIFEEVDAAPGE
jgi:hypothetical protein